jgi:small subunit ribosomal protein S4
MLSNVLINASQVYEWITWNNDVKEGTFVSYQLDFKSGENIKNN